MKKDTKKQNESLVGRKAYGVDGFAVQEGVIVGEQTDRWGEWYIVEWENGWRENFAKHQLKPIEQKCGIGVYYGEVVEQPKQVEIEYDLAAFAPTRVM